jgi:molybdopterin-binding protein
METPGPGGDGRLGADEALPPKAYRVAEAAELLGVSADTVRRWSDSGKLASSRDAGGRRVIEGPALANLAAQLGRSPGTDVGPTGGHSARNRFPGIVTKVTKDLVMAQVEFQAGPFRLVSLMSREAADDLGLASGVVAVASVKATNVTMELPAGNHAP